MSQTINKYHFKRALRPFSFSVAIITCLVGIISAYGSERFSWGVATAILSGAVILQAGVNLINDHADLNLLRDEGQRELVRRNFRIGLVCFLMAAAIGTYLVFMTGPGLMLLMVLGLAGALGYTMEPINFKRRGMAVALVFWLMGVLMVCGSYYILSQSLDWHIFWRAVPVSLISSLLLLSNEIRDVESDGKTGIRTLTVRIGRHKAEQLYTLLMLMIAVVTLGLWWIDEIQSGWWLISLPLMLLLFRQLHSEQGVKTLPQSCGRFFMLFGLLYCISL